MQLSGKIKEIEDLAHVLGALREDNKKIAQCHGVFDLLHIGHIQHLEQAKKLGDVLVVTLTPDKHVNKGPHRPVFGQDLRAQAIAALNCVDYVAINKWPLADRTIQFLRPDIYVKGTEYKVFDDDETGGIAVEEEAIRSVGGRLAFTNGMTFSSSNLINRYLPVFPQEVKDYLRSFSERYSADDILQYLERARSLNVLVVGEAIIDEYQYCEAIGKSSKAPTLAVKQLSLDRSAGGILAVGNHVANFCQGVGLITFLGKESSEEEFVTERLNNKINSALLSLQNAPTIVKRRFVESYCLTKLLEVYEMDGRPLNEFENKSLCTTLREQIPHHDLVIVVDFGHGMLSPEAIDILCSEARFLAVNTQSNAGNLGYHTISKYPRADYVCIAEGEIRLEARDRPGDLKEIILDVSRRLSCPRVVVTQGKSGCLCYSEGEGFFQLPPFATQVVDRVGAGDAFLSLTAPCVVQEAPIELVGFLGNAVGAQAVATIGHQTSIQRLPLYRHIEYLLK